MEVALARANMQLQSICQYLPIANNTLLEFDIFSVVNWRVALIISVDKSTEEIYTKIKYTEYSLHFHENTPELSISQK
jgi:hypothetical protein